MKNFYFSLQLILLCFPLSTRLSGQFLFVENKGQWEEDFLYKTDLPTGALFFAPGKLVYHFADLSEIHHLHEKGEKAPENLEISGHAFEVEFTGSNTEADFTGQHPMPYYYNYFLGNNPNRWRGGIYPQQKIRWQDLYNGIHMDWYSVKGTLKYDFIVSPGVNPSQIKMKYNGVPDLALRDGKIEIVTQVGTLSDQVPVAYQLINGDTVTVSCSFRLKNQEVSFELGAYNPQYELVIDPSLIFGSYSGSTTDNWGYCATYDALGFLYAGGIANGMGYPTTLGAYDVTWNGGDGTTFPSDIAISKYDTTGGFMIYSTYLGGNGSELPHSLIVNNYDELFIFGTTGSADYPTTSNAYDQSFNSGVPNTTTSMNIDYDNGSDLIVTRINVNGTALMASTYIGGTSNDGINASPPLRFNYADEVRGEIIIDNLNNIYVATTTRSTDFPVTQGCFQGSYGGGNQDGVVFKMDNSLTTLLWSSYYGGSGLDAIYALDLYQNNDIVVSGGTNSNNLFMVGPNFNTYNGGNADGFVARISADGSTVLNSMYVGSPNYDQTYLVEKDKFDNIYVLGQTSAPGTYYIQNANFNTPSGGQYIRKYSSDFQNIIWSTAFGTGDGSPDISPSAFLVDVCNKIYVSGWGGAVNSSFFAGSTTCGLPVTLGAFQTTTDCSDYYLMVIDDSANALVYATYYGGSSAEHVDGGTSRFNRKGEIYQSVCAGCGSIDDFPTTPGAHSQTNNSVNCNNGVFKFAFDFPSTVADFLVPSSECVPALMSFDNTSTGANSYMWYFGDGDSSDLEHPSHTYLNPGTYVVTLIAIDSTGSNCNLSDTARKQVLILSDSTRIFSDIDLCTGQSVVIGIPPNGDPSLTYTWSPTTGLSDPAVSNPIASPTVTTTYQLLITNGNCVDTIIQKLNVLDLPPPIDTTYDLCSGDTVLIGLTNTNGITSVQWTPNNNLVDANSAFTGAFPTSTTTYQLNYGNSACTDSALFTINIVNGVSYTNPPTLICKGDQIQLDAGNTDNINFQWTPSTGLNDPTSPNPVASPDSSITYVLYMDDGNCFDTLTQTVNVLSVPPLSLSDYSLCIGESVQIGMPDPTGGQLSFVWTPSTYLSNANVSDPTATPASSITYELTYFLTGAPTLCNGSDSVSIHVDTQLPIAGFSYFPSGTCDGIKLNFTDNSSNADSTFWVVDGDTLSWDELTNYLAEFNDTVVISMITLNGECRDSTSQVFGGGAFADYFQLEMPNVFTPQVSAGINDEFCPIGFGGQACYKMWIYNRWGTIVWSSDPDHACWPGTVHYSNTFVTDGVYYWVLEYGGDNDKEQGFVHVISHQ